MLKHFTVFLMLLSAIVRAQYTDQINSNRPGASIGAFAVGKGIVQFEGGLEYRRFKHEAYNNSTVDGRIGFLSIRWGFLFEQLELTYDGSYMMDRLTNKISSKEFEYERKGFLKNFIGIKYLVYDPFKKEEEVNNYSWKANNGFKLKHLIPAVSITAGANFNIEPANPYPYGDVFDLLNRPLFFQNLNTQTEKEPLLSLGGTIATQSHFLGTWVFVTNFSLSRYLTDYVEKSYLLTLTHTFHPYWSVYVENQGVFSELHNDFIFRTGIAYLLTDYIQIEGSLGVNTQTKPSSTFVNLGVSYRLNFHKDFTSAEEINFEKQKNEEKGLKKLMKKDSKQEKKRNRKAKRK